MVPFLSSDFIKGNVNFLADVFFGPVFKVSFPEQCSFHSVNFVVIVDAAFFVLVVVFLDKVGLRLAINHHVLELQVNLFLSTSTLVTHIVSRG